MLFRIHIYPSFIAGATPYMLIGATYPDISFITNQIDFAATHHMHGESYKRLLHLANQLGRNTLAFATGIIKHARDDHFLGYLPMLATPWQGEMARMIFEELRSLEPGRTFNECSRPLLVTTGVATSELNLKSEEIVCPLVSHYAEAVLMDPQILEFGRRLWRVDHDTIHYLHLRWLQKLQQLSAVKNDRELALLEMSAVWPKFAVQYLWQDGCLSDRAAGKLRKRLVGQVDVLLRMAEKDPEQDAFIRNVLHLLQPPSAAKLH
jgi:hypothetical protein